MAKRNKHTSKSPTKPARSATKAESPAEAGASAAATAIHPPAKHPSLLAISVTLFVLWFLFLLITALRMAISG